MIHHQDSSGPVWYVSAYGSDDSDGSFNFPFATIPKAIDMASNGDTVLVGSKTNIVQIFGEVNSPGNYRFYDNFSLRDYIKMAGGYTKNASVRASYVQYPDGKSKQVALFKRIKIIDSTIITVGRKEEVEPFSFTDYATKLTSIYADLTQALLLITLAGQNN